MDQEAGAPCRRERRIESTVALLWTQNAVSADAGRAADNRPKPISTSMRIDLPLQSLT